MNKKLVPMPKVGDIISPIHGLETIAWWEKPVKPYGKFVRIVWDESSKKHSAVCKKEYTTGIVAFLNGKPPGFGDVLKVTSIGTNTCRVIAINMYHDVIIKSMKEYACNEESEDGYSLIDYLIDNIYALDEECTDVSVIQPMAMAAWGLSSYLKNGIPSEKRQVKGKSDEEE